MTVAFVRQLGAEAGVQLNPLRDESEIPVQDNYDQVIGIMMRATRGRIDKPFKVHRGNVYRKIGRGEPMRTNALNEAWVQVVEAVNNGAYEVVVQRLVGGSAVVKYAVLTGYSAATPTPVWTKETVLPTAFDLAIKHLECFNDEVIVELHAEEVKRGGVAVDNKFITLRLRDKDGFLLMEFTGGLDPAGLDDFGNSNYLPEVVAAQTDLLEVVVGAGFTSVRPTDSGYGYDINGRQAWHVSPPLNLFDEGGHLYSVQQLQAARHKLQYTPYNYAYIMSGGTKSTAMLYQLMQLAYDTNRLLRFDVPGDLTPEGAIAFYEQLNVGTMLTPGNASSFWAPLKTDDPSGINGKGYFGVSGLQCAYACSRNAQTNARGFAPKNYPIAGKAWPIRRTGIKQMYDLSNQELNELARSQINPVVHENFSGGGRYVFRDVLTGAQVESSLLKLNSVADMSTHIDDGVTRAGKDFMHLPMQIAIKRMKDYLQSYFEGAQASGWLVPSNDPSMDGKAFRYEVKPNDVRPYDRMDVSYWLRYDGVARQIFVTQTLSK